MKIKKIHYLITNSFKKKFLLLIFTINSIILAEETLKSSVTSLNNSQDNKKAFALLEKKLDLKIDINESTFFNRLYDLRTGQIDLALGLYKTEDRKNFIYFIKKPYKKTAKKTFFILKENYEKLKSYNDLKSLKIGVGKYSKYYERFDYDYTLNKKPVLNVLRHFHNLENKKIDTLIYSEEGGLKYIKENNLENKIVIANYDIKPHESVYIGISRKSKLMDNIKEVEKKIIELIENKKFDIIFNPPLKG